VPSAAPRTSTARDDHGVTPAGAKDSGGGLGAFLAVREDGHREMGFRIVPVTGEVIDSDVHRAGDVAGEPVVVIADVDDDVPVEGGGEILR
jgi:hypothetical protein